MTETSQSLQIRVECYAGYRADEQPRRFYIGERCYEVSEVIDQWYGPDYRYFKLRTEDDGIYILRHGETKDIWELTLFDSGSEISIELNPDQQRPC